MDIFARAALEEPRSHPKARQTHSELELRRAAALAVIRQSAETVRIAGAAVSTFADAASGDVVVAIEDASLSAQVAATEDILSAQNQQLGVLRQQLELGGRRGRAHSRQCLPQGRAEEGLLL